MLTIYPPEGDGLTMVTGVIETDQELDLAREAMPSINMPEATDAYSNGIVYTYREIKMGDYVTWMVR